MNRPVMLFFVAFFLQSCTYTVAGPEPASTVAADDQANPHLQVAGLEQFRQSVKTVTHICSSATVEIDYQDEALRRTHAVWQSLNAAGGPDMAGGVVRFTDLTVISRCHAEGGFDAFCASKATIRAEFSPSHGGTSVPKAVSVTEERRADTFGCEGTGESVQLAVDAALAAALNDLLAAE